MQITILIHNGKFRLLEDDTIIIEALPSAFGDLLTAHYGPAMAELMFEEVHGWVLRRRAVLKARNASAGLKDSKGCGINSRQEGWG